MEGRPVFADVALVFHFLHLLMKAFTIFNGSSHDCKRDTNACKILKDHGFSNLKDSVSKTKDICAYKSLVFLYTDQFKCSANHAHKVSGNAQVLKLGFCKEGSE